VSNFIAGQRVISDAELEMGLGTVLAADERTVTIVFMANGETRIYSLETAPITRVVFTIGDNISSHDGRIIRVTRVDEKDGLVTYTGTDQAQQYTELPEAELDNFIQLNRPSERLFHGHVDPLKWFDLRRQTLDFQNQLACSDLYGLSGCRTSLIPHQLYIAHEVANRYAPRVLLADEVGLGKTIEAGLILHHQLLTGRARRVLIVVPESLVHQWLVEMLRRFNLHFRIFDEERCLGIAGDDADGNIFLAEQLVLCSIDFLHDNPDITEQALAGDWDLLVVDEAHHLTWTPQAASREYLVIEKLAAITRGVLLLTATPEQLGKQSHFARLRLLDPDRFPSYEQFIEEEKHYQPVAQTIDDLVNDRPLSEADQKLIRDTLNEGDNEELLSQLHIAGHEDEAGTRARGELVEHLLDRHGTGRVLFRNTRQAVKGFPQRVVHAEPLPIPDIYNDVFSSADIDQLPTPELACQADDWTNKDPRLNWLVARLEQLNPAKVLVIASSKNTALDIADHLRIHSGTHAAVFHEGLSIVERDRAAAYFADMESGTQVLICSEIGSEGRNFQFAHHLVLFDLPLNPDLLEQRIGRLDRIGQSETIHIHVPYLDNSPQAVLFRWYHEGLNAFEQTCPVGHAVSVQVRDLLEQALLASASKMDDLLNTTKALYDKLTRELHAGRDRLLEYNSCRIAIAEDLKQRAAEDDHNPALPAYMTSAFDCLGIDSEVHSDNCLIIRPSDELVNQVPGLPDDGLTITFDRDTALSFEDAQYITWEHPLTRTIMDMVTSTEMGNTALTAISKTHIPQGSLLLECIYRLEVPPDSALQSERYLPPTSIRVVLDEQGRNHADTLPAEMINDHRVHVPANMVNKIIRAKEKALSTILASCDDKAEEHAPQLIENAHQQSSVILLREINRLQALRQINPNIRDEEIEFFQSQLTSLSDVLDNANMRLDSLRVIAAL
jgi:ATP-dependent helicase HepA